MRSAAPCPDDNAVAAFVEGRLATTEGESVEEHLDSCADCRVRVSALAQLVSRSFGSGSGAAAAAEMPVPAGGAIGRYLLLRAIGAGGMGVVYAAYDPELRRLVALKLLRAGASSPEAQLGLLREAQAMARLQHPNVIAVHDVGAIDGRVFLAMELVDGATLRAWRAAAARPAAEILALFAQAGRGLAAAHAAGLVHRDFKPDNVLVGGDGRARVTDFGLARGSGDAAADGALAGTPAYMAPEQRAGRNADARSDQFNFCVALYEALFGRRPPAENISPRSAPSLPRSPLLPRPAARALARGLHPDPERRFPSMGALLDALEPAPRATRRARALLAVLAAATVALAVAYARVARRPATYCRGAEQKLKGVWDPARAAAVRAAFAATGLPYAGDTFRSVSGAMDRYAQRWTAAYTDACEATRLRGEQSEEILSLRMTCLDRRRRELAALSDLLARAEAPLVERAPQAMERLSSVEDCADLAALGARRRQAPGGRAVDEVEAALAEVRALEAAGRYPESIARAESALARARPLGDHAALADALLALANAQARSGQSADAERHAAEAAFESEAAGLDELKTRALLLLARITGTTRVAAAHDALGRAAAAIERLGGDPRLKIKLAQSEAQVLDTEGRYPEQLARIQEAVALEERLSDGDPLAHANLVNELSSALDHVGRREEALAAASCALATQERVLGPAHPTVAHTLHNVGVALLDMERAAEALPSLERARKIWLATTPETLNAAHTHDSLGNALLALGRLDEAEASYGRAIALLEKLLGPENPQLAFSLQNLGELRQRQGRLAEAEALHRRALAILEPSLGARHPDLSYPLVNLSLLAARRQHFVEALALARRALELIEQASGRDHPSVARALLAIAEILGRRGTPAAALEPLERAVRILDARGDDRRKRAEARFELARALWSARRDRPRARTLAKSALELYAQAGDGSAAQPVERWLAGK